MTHDSGRAARASDEGSRAALVISYSDIATDPRVRREVDWLCDAGWTVDSLGLGEHPTPRVDEHYALGRPWKWTQSKLGTLISHVLFPPKLSFRILTTRRIPRALRDRVRRGEYDLVVFNEFEFVPWAQDPRDFTPAARRGTLHLDLHEFRNPSVRRMTLGGKLTGRYYRWVRQQLGSRVFDSRTVVNIPIGRLYADEFGFPVPTEVRNAPPMVPGLAPSPVDPAEIRLLFHGLPSWLRGFDDILAALEGLPDTFSMTFMLMPQPKVHARLRESIAKHPARNRIRIVPPAPMREIAARINEYDLEIIFYKPLEPNLQYAMPNKFFEAAQGRLGVVVGETPTMAPLVREYGHGVVVPEFTADSLRETLAALTADAVATMKKNAAVVAESINADSEGAAFLSAVRAVEKEKSSREG